ncbi:hypothetical protein [Streptomyces sp. NPDC002088]|uniref:hypothetical protein n=1 Tax=Streptomyces sp. NPDC002088 TaxID=3154665 RepID=UPI0033340CDA
MTAGWCSRTVRAAVFAAVCVLLAALGHVMMSGSYVPGRVLAAGLAMTGAAGWCLAGRERGLPLVVTVVVATQTVLHSAFSLARSASGGMASMDMGHMDMSGMAHMDHMDMRHMDYMDHVDYMGQSMSGSSMRGGTSSFGMLAAHLLAALLCGLWLAYGEKAAFRILRAVAGRLAAPLRLLLALPATPDRPRIGARRPRSDRAPRLLLLVHAITSRGPPVGTAVG